MSLEETVRGRLDSIVQRHRDIEAEMARPDVAADYEKLATLAQEQKQTRDLAMILMPLCEVFPGARTCNMRAEFGALRSGTPFKPSVRRLCPRRTTRAGAWWSMPRGATRASP